MRHQELLFSASVLSAAIALNNCRHLRGSGPCLRARRFTPAGSSLPFALRGMLTLLLEPILLERARKSGSPALLKPSFKVQRDATHYQSSGLPSPRGFKGLNARDPLK